MKSSEKQKIKNVNLSQFQKFKTVLFILIITFVQNVNKVTTCLMNKSVLKLKPYLVVFLIIRLLQQLSVKNAKTVLWFNPIFV